MRKLHLVAGAMVIAGGMALGGCEGTKVPAATMAAAEVKAGGVVVELPAGWTAVNEGANVRLHVPHDNNDIVIRLVPGAVVPGDALVGLAAGIHDEVHDFKAVKVEELTLAGKPGKHVIGVGSEADDGDPSNAEVFVFVVGSKVYMACVHGENTAAQELRPMAMKVINSAKAR